MVKQIEGKEFFSPPATLLRVYGGGTEMGEWEMVLVRKGFLAADFRGWNADKVMSCGVARYGRGMVKG